MFVRDHPGLCVSPLCGILSIGRASFYYRAKGESAGNLACMRHLDELFLKYPFCGSRKMARQLRREGLCAGRHHRQRRLAGYPAGENGTRDIEKRCNGKIFIARLDEAGDRNG